MQLLYNTESLGATVAERLACSPPTKANLVQSPMSTCRNRAGRCRRSAGFLGDLPLFHYVAARYSPHRISRYLSADCEIGRGGVSSIPPRRRRRRGSVVIWPSRSRRVANTWFRLVRHGSPPRAFCRVPIPRGLPARYTSIHRRVEGFPAIPATHNSEALRAGESEARGDRRTPRKSDQSVASSGTIPTCENLGASLQGIEPGSLWWEVIDLAGTPTAAPQNDRCTWGTPQDNSNILHVSHTLCTMTAIVLSTDQRTKNNAGRELRKEVPRITVFALLWHGRPGDLVIDTRASSVARRRDKRSLFRVTMNKIRPGPARRCRGSGVLTVVDAAGRVVGGAVDCAVGQDLEVAVLDVHLYLAGGACDVRQVGTALAARRGVVAGVGRRPRHVVAVAVERPRQAGGG
ncbi:hypothetical protein PR048_014786 [Dryococelus australis]|uniref:Uncharacterized protein n=1 Tax=Dryococelus australis TaxID=614101 RepID=A0ABQ9HF51_9NEOP|nr:hypothetical protein PR048_014786 [Dryococelus australis]